MSKIYPIKLSKKEFSLRIRSETQEQQIVLQIRKNENII